MAAQLSDGPHRSGTGTDNTRRALVIMRTVRNVLAQHGGEVTVPDVPYVEAPLQDGWTLDSGSCVLVEAGAQISPMLRITVTGPNCTVVLCSDSEFRRGSEIRVEGRGSWIFIGRRARLGGCKIFVRGRSCGVALGEAVSWESGAALCYREDQTIILGDDCMLSNDVRLRTEDGHAIFDRTTQQRLNPSASVIIASHVWLGHGATISKGTRIGRGAVIGAESVATGTLDAHAIHAGVPARMIRKDVTWSRTPAWNDIPEAYR